MSFKISCPHCKRALNVTEPAFGKTVPCPGCKQPIKVPHPAAVPSSVPAQRDAPWIGSTEDRRTQASSVPPLMPPTPDGHLPNDPLAFFRSESTAASTGSEPLDFLSVAPSSSSPPAMPPFPEGGHVSTTDETDVLIARYRSQVKPRGEEIRKRIAQGTDVVKKRAWALKLRHDVSSLWTAVNSQLESLGTLAITHRPPTVDISSEIAELSQVQRELSQHQVTIDSLRQGAGGRSVVKQIEGEITRLRDRQREAVIAIGRKVAATRPDMPDAAGTYSAIDRVQSSLTATESQLAEIEKEIGPSGLVGGLSFGEAGTISKIASPSAFAFALFLFFLPWLTVSCQNRNAREIKVLSQSGFQTCYSGKSLEHPEADRKSAAGKSSDAAGIKDPSPALLIVLYGAAVAAGIALSVAVFMGNERLRKWVVTCSVAAFCVLTMQMMLGFPVESWIRGLPRERSQQRNSMTLDDQMGTAMALAAIESGAIIVRYTFFLWMSWLVVLAPAAVVAGEEWLLRNRANRSPPEYT